MIIIVCLTDIKFKKSWTDDFISLGSVIICRFTYISWIHLEECLQELFSSRKLLCYKWNKFHKLAIGKKLTMKNIRGWFKEVWEVFFLKRTERIPQFAAHQNFDEHKVSSWCQEMYFYNKFSLQEGWRRSIEVSFFALKWRYLQEVVTWKKPKGFRGEGSTGRVFFLIILLLMKMTD